MLDKQGTGIPDLVEKETTLAKLSILLEISLLNQSSNIKFFKLGSFWYASWIFLNNLDLIMDTKYASIKIN